MGIKVKIKDPKNRRSVWGSDDNPPFLRRSNQNPEDLNDPSPSGTCNAGVRPLLGAAAAAALKRSATFRSFIFGRKTQHVLETCFPSSEYIIVRVSSKNPAIYNIVFYTNLKRNLALKQCHQSPTLIDSLSSKARPKQTQPQTTPKYQNKPVPLLFLCFPRVFLGFSVFHGKNTTARPLFAGLRLFGLQFGPHQGLGEQLQEWPTTTASETKAKQPTN